MLSVRGGAMGRMVGLVVLCAGCGDEWFLSGDKGDDDDSTSVSDETTPGDADADADADSDADSDTDTDTDADCPLDCDGDPIATPDPGSGVGACVTETVQCGDVVEGTLVGGSQVYDYDFWLLVGELDALFGEYTALDGPERVYTMRVEPGQVVRATFETCFDLWANWVLMGDTGGAFCDTDTYYTAGVFEGDATTGCPYGWYTERLNSGSSPYDLELIVEGLYGATGNYRLTVECF
jgi:hypothetical protein